MDSDDSSQSSFTDDDSSSEEVLVHPRKLAYPCLVQVLDERLPKEITDEILEYVCRSNLFGDFEVDYVEDYKDVIFGYNRLTQQYCTKCGDVTSGSLSDYRNTGSSDEDGEGSQNISYHYQIADMFTSHKCGKKPKYQAKFLPKLRSFWRGELTIDF